MADKTIWEYPTLATADPDDLILMASDETTYNMQVATLKAAMGEAASKPPVVRNGNWWVWSAAQNDYVDSGTTATGPRGPKGDTGDTGDKGDTGEKGDTGDTGAAAGFGTVSATVDSNVGTPSVDITTSGPDTAKNIAFAFHNMKGDTGDVTPAVQALVNQASQYAQAAGNYADNAEDSADRAEQAASTLDNTSAYGEVGPVAIASIQDALPLNAESLVVDIEPVQSGSGDPSPTNVRPISGWTGAQVTVNEDVLNITFPSAAGTVYGGTLDVTMGLLTVTMAEVDLGTLNWTTIAPTATIERRFYSGGISSVVKRPPSSTTVTTARCECYAPATDIYVNNAQHYNFHFAIGRDSYIYIRDSRFETTEDFKAAMSGVQLVYELAVPITYQLTPHQVALLQGENNVWADCGDTTVGFWRDDSLSINKAITERAYDRQQGEALTNDVGALSSAMTYVVSGNKSVETATIPVGAYVRLVGSTIAGRSDGIYTVATAIPVDTVIDGTYFNESAPIQGGGLNAINSKFAWKLAGTQTGNTHIQLPAEFNELMVHVCGGSKYINFTVPIPKNVLSTNELNFSIGAYFSSSSYNSIIIIASIREVYLDIVKGTGSDITQSSTITVMYR